eukprot:8352946-Pyramimonas_sp.AAC.1
MSMRHWGSAGALWRSRDDCQMCAGSVSKGAPRRQERVASGMCAGHAVLQEVYEVDFQRCEHRAKTR